MPRRHDISSILIIGSGPIVIGQACEFDYSGTQAVRALKEDGFRVILVNSNPATIMTDPELADATYIEPLTVDDVTAVIEKERPDALLPTMGGQTALNLALELEERGILSRFGVQLIGANTEAIRTAEDRDLFRLAMADIGIECAKSELVRDVEDGLRVAQAIGLPVVLRPSRTLGGTGGGIIYDEAELRERIGIALAASPNHEVLIEESLIGWKEIELEVMRDTKDNVVIVCPIENLDPMGVHTGDSITVAPIQTLTDKEYQLLRDCAVRVMRRIGVDTGGSNVQFAIHPGTGRVIVIEMNPRVSRSSALASKATGFPIAKIAAKLAVGYTLDEIPNDITRETPACFEPSIDYVVVKIPRFTFEKFATADRTLGTQMKSVGEVMAIGRNFREALQKAICSLEEGRTGFDREVRIRELSNEVLERSVAVPTPERLYYVGEALRRGWSVEKLYTLSAIDRWFLAEIAAIIEAEEALRRAPESLHRAEALRSLKRAGFSDARIAQLTGEEERAVRELRWKLGVRPVFKLVDTCAAEFRAETPYMYSSYDAEDERVPAEGGSVVILGSGPNRIGQGIEFDYCCVHAVQAMREQGIPAVMINCNPETVSTDYDMSDRLYFEPLTLESVLEIVARERPRGVVVQFGGQTPLKIAADLERLGVPILGTSVESIDVAEDRERFSELVAKLGLRQAEHRTARSVDGALQAARSIGYPVMARPSFVLGGRAMRIIHNDEELRQYLGESVEVSGDRPVLLDRYLLNAIEVDVDALSDGQEVIIGGVMEHIERAGVHSGDSSFCFPPVTLEVDTVERLKAQTAELARSLQVVGLLNVQFAVQGDGSIFVLEANPRASRTVPFIGKVTGVPWARVAARAMVGVALETQGVSEIVPRAVSVKTSVFPFRRFPGVDSLLGPEMRSTGEVMGIDDNFAGAFLRAQRAAGLRLPRKGTVFFSVRDADKQDCLPVARALVRLGLSLTATRGTASFLQEQGVPVTPVRKVAEGSPHVVDLIRGGSIQLVINTPEGSGPLLDSRSIRLSAMAMDIPTYTTIAAASAAVESMLIEEDDGPLVEVRSLQDYHRSYREAKELPSQGDSRILREEKISSRC